MRSYQHP